MESGKDKMIVVATKEEYLIAKQRFKYQKIVQTGVGALNVIETLRKYPRWKRIINFGYAGSNRIPVGTEVRIGYSALYHPKVDYLEPGYILDTYDEAVTCYTSSDFVTETEEDIPCVFDMELAYICALGFKNVKAIKIVSDNLSLKQYEEEIK